MQLTRSSVEQGTAKGPAEWFTEDVYIHTVATASAPSRVLASLVHFMPGARTAWHRHPLGQSQECHGVDDRRRSARHRRVPAAGSATVAGAADPYRTPHLGRLIQVYAGCTHMTRE